MFGRDSHVVQLNGSFVWGNGEIFGGDIGGLPGVVRWYVGF